jgi:putative flippase GtrA
MKKIQPYIFCFLDFFYPMAKPFFPKQTYYYLACGSFGTLLGLLVYGISYHFILNMQPLDLGFYTFSAHIASLFITTLTTFPVSFLLTKFIVWSDSNLASKKQLFRHFNFLIFSTLLNIVLLKLLVDYFKWWPMPSQIVTTIIIVIFSYLTQRFISFKKV